MFQKSSKFLSLLLAAVTMAGLASGCGGSGKPAGEAAAPEVPVTEDENIDLSGNLPVIKDPGKFPKMKMLIVSSPERVVEPAEIETVKIAAEATGIYFDWVNIPSDGAVEKLNLMLSSGEDLPDCFYNFTDGKSGTFVVQYMGQNVFRPTEDLIENYMPNLKAILEKRPDYAKGIVAPDGHTYGFPYIEEMKGLVLTPGPFLINKTWLDKVGKPMPTTVDEWVDCMKAFRDAGDINGNGQQDEFPIACGFGSTDTFGSYNIFYRFTGAFGSADSYCGGYNLADHLRIVDGKVAFTALDDAFKKTANFFNMLYTENLIDPDSFSLGTNSATPLYVSSKIKGDTAVLGSFGVWSDMDITNNDVRHEYEPLPRLTGENGKTGFELNYSEMQDTSDLAITTSCKYPEVIAKWVDYCLDPVTSITMNWGALDYTYFKGDDGKLHFNLDERGDIICVEPYQTFGEMRANTATARGSMIILNEYYDEYADYTYDAKNLLDFQIVNGKNEIMEEYTTVPKMLLTVDEQTKLAQIQPQIASVVDRYVSQWVMEGNADATWDQYRQELEAAGVNDLVSTFQQAYDRFLGDAQA